MENRTEDIVHGAVINFGKRVRALREGRGLTQSALARRMGEVLGKNFHQTIVAKIEAGTRIAMINEVVVLAGIFEIEPGQFFERDGAFTQLSRTLADGNLENAIAVMTQAIDELDANRTSIQVIRSMNQSDG